MRRVVVLGSLIAEFNIFEKEEEVFSMTTIGEQ